MKTDTQTLRLRGPADLVPFIPYALGFQPLESLVLVGLAGTRLVVTARVDVVDATLGTVSDVCGTLRRSGATAVAGIVVTDHPALASDVQTHLNYAAECAKLRVLDLLLVTGDEWRSLHSTDPECRAQQGHPMPSEPTAVDAAAVYAGLVVLPSRDALAAMFAPVPGRPNLGAELRRHWGLRDAAGEDGELRGWERSAMRALFRKYLKSVAPPGGTSGWRQAASW